MSGFSFAGSTLVQFVNLSPMDLAWFVKAALVPPEAWTPELEELCRVCDGAMPGESGEDSEDRNRIVQASERLQALCEVHMLPDHGCRVALPAGAVVVRIVTLSFYC